MGHSTVLVIGDNFRDQLEKYECFEYAYPTNKHIVTIDALAKAKQNYENCSDDKQIGFLSWVKKHYAIAVLNEAEDPDFFGAHKNGWVRLGPGGEVTELMERTIPGGFLDWFEGTVNDWKLKPGAEGLVINMDGEEKPATDGYAGSARKCAIDLDGMRDPIHSLQRPLCYREIIMNGELLTGTVEERQLFDSLPEDIILTLAYVHE